MNRFRASGLSWRPDKTTVMMNEAYDAKQERRKHFHEKWFSPNTRSKIFANVEGQLAARFLKSKPINHTAISNFVFSVNTASTFSKNFHTPPASTPPAAI